MNENSNTFILALGGVALVLGLAYGWTAREHRSEELVVLKEQVAQADDSRALLEGKVEESRALLEEKSGEVADLEARIAELETELKAALEAKPAVAEETPAEEEPAVEVASAAAAAGGQFFGDADAGEQVFKKCTACHSIGQGAEDRVGPHLNGIFGRRAGAHEGFKYSDDMAMMGSDGLTWTLETLNAYVENPKALVSRTRMNFAGLDDPEERADLMAFLRVYSDDPSNIPEAAPTRSREVQLSAEVLAIEGDPAYGEYLSSECTTCHQTDGGDEGIPSITSWPSEDFVIAMHAYKTKLRPHPVMQMMAGRLNDEEIAALAAYFGGL